jgi:serine protease inhibitor
MKNNIFRTCLVLLIAMPLLFSKCSKTPDEIFPEDPVPIDLSADQVTLIESENTFAFDFFGELMKTTGINGNVMVSPLSISVALSMTLNGADGATRDSMLKALRVAGITPEAINNAYKNLAEALLSVDKRINMSIANSVWTENNFVVKQPFIDILKNYYDAESRSFDINDPSAPDDINAWIEDKTNGLIKKMVESLNDNTVMLLINAIYFKGKWKSQFDETKTEQMPFYTPSGSSPDVPMMRQTTDFEVYDGDGFILAEFPYGQGNYVMDVVLPDEMNGISGLLPQFTEANFQTWLNHLAERETNLYFPRFKYGFKKQLKGILTTMGMGIAFTDDADFSNISDLDLLINEVTHQTFIETNEEGTEAAAVTIVDIGVTSMPPPPLVVKLDHPFIYLIRETTTNSIIFMGMVADPLAN